MKDVIVAIISAAIEKAHAAGKLKSSGVAVGTESPKDPVAWRYRLERGARARARGGQAASRDRRKLFATHIELPDDVKEATSPVPASSTSEWRRVLASRDAPRDTPEARVLSSAQMEAARRRQRYHPGRVSVRESYGPLTVGHGRNAVLGDTIARLYEAAGFTVNREYYFNDGGRQMRLLGESVRVRYLQELGREAKCPRTATRASTSARSRARCGASGATILPILRIARSFAPPQ